MRDEAGLGAVPDGFQIDVTIVAGNWPEEGVLVQTIEDAVGAVFKIGRVQAQTGSEVSLVFSNDEAVRALNLRWRGKDKSTNVLSFPGSDLDGDVYGPLLGDIVLAWETVIEEAAELGIEFRAHLSHLVVHGMLHLFDYDHQEKDEADVMEALERRILEDLGIADPYAERPLIADED